MAEDPYVHLDRLDQFFSSDNYWTPIDSFIDRHFDQYRRASHHQNREIHSKLKDLIRELRMKAYEGLDPEKALRICTEAQKDDQVRLYYQLDGVLYHDEFDFL